MSIHPIFILQLAAPHTPNGNPNRVYVAIDIVFGDIIGAWDEGYSGTAAIPDSFKGAGFYGTSSPLRINVRASEAKDFLREGRAALAKAGHSTNPRKRAKPRRRNPSVPTAKEAKDTASALVDTFGQQYRDCTTFQRECLLADLFGLWEEDGGDDQWSLWDAAKELRRRLGGTNNLIPYAQSLEAGARQRR